MMMRLVFEAKVARSGDRFVISIPKRLNEKASKLHKKEVIVIVEEPD